jgi:hypothetical protein
MSAQTKPKSLARSSTSEPSNQCRKKIATKSMHELLNELKVSRRNEVQLTQKRIAAYPVKASLNSKVKARANAYGEAVQSDMSGHHGGMTRLSLMSNSV